MYVIRVRVIFDHRYIAGEKTSPKIYPSASEKYLICLSSLAIRTTTGWTLDHDLYLYHPLAHTLVLLPDTLLSGLWPRLTTWWLSRIIRKGSGRLGRLCGEIEANLYAN